MKDLDKIIKVFSSLGVRIAYNTKPMPQNSSNVTIMLWNNSKKFVIGRSYDCNDNLILDYYQQICVGKVHVSSFEEVFDNMPANIQENIMFNLDLFQRKLS